MKLREYAKLNSVTYRTAYNHWKSGYIKGKQLKSGTIVILDEESNLIENKVILYARISSSENKNNLELQLNRLRDYANAKGYIIEKEIKEIGSGLDDKRQQLENIFKSNDWNILIVEHKDRLIRFGINYLEILLNKDNKKIEIINNTDEKNDDLMQDFVSIITSFTARLYGLRRSKRKIEKIIKELKNDKK